MKNTEKQKIIDLCRWSPTPDNCQPWTFEWKDNSLLIFHDDNKSNHPLNPKNVTSILMLGCLLETIQIAASQFGYKISYDLSLENHEHWCTTHFNQTHIESDPLTNSIQLRCTDRRVYQKTMPTKPFKITTTSFGQSQLHQTQNLSSKLSDYFVESEQFLIQHESILPSVMKWVRFSQKEAFLTKDGFTWKNMLAKIWEVPALRLIRKYPQILKILRANLKNQHRQRTLEQAQSADGFICVSIPNKSQQTQMDLVDAGRSMMRIWLELTHQKMAVQPMSLSTLPILFDQMNVMDDFFVKNKDLILQGQNILRESFQIDQTQIPIWMLRYGTMDPLPLELRTYRKDVESIIRN